MLYILPIKLVSCQCCLHISTSYTAALQCRAFCHMHAFTAERSDLQTDMIFVLAAQAATISNAPCGKILSGVLTLYVKSLTPLGA